MAEVIWSPEAIQDLEEIAAFIARDSEYHTSRSVRGPCGTEVAGPAQWIQNQNRRRCSRGTSAADQRQTAQGQQQERSRLRDYFG